MAKRVVLAYSGGLDTSVAVAWLKEKLRLEVIAVAVDVGQGGDLEAVRKRALESGAVEAVVLDGKKKFADEVLTKALGANALYEGRYPLVSALSRPLIVELMVEEAKKFNADGLAHGCTGKGNDQVRFEVATRALAPELEIIAPVRTWNMTREESINYATEHGIKIPVTKDRLYSIDENIWGRAIECGELEDPFNSPPPDIWEMTVDKGENERDIVVGFAEGIPVSIDGENMDFLTLLSKMNEIVGSYGFGRIDMVENRRVGIKSRETYEAPGALALIMCHRDLEGITLERELSHEKSRLEPKWAELAYDGLWFSPLMEALNAFMDKTQKYVSGEVRLHLRSGSAVVNGRRSKLSLYDYDLATYDASDSFRHEDAEGFIRIFGLGIETWAHKQKFKESDGRQ